MTRSNILVIDAHPMNIPGVWRIRAGNKQVATLVQPNVDVSLGLLPTSEHVIAAVREVTPTLPITEATKIRYAGGELHRWVHFAKAIRP